MSSSIAKCECNLCSCVSSALLTGTLVAMATLIMLRELVGEEAFVIGVTRLVYPEGYRGYICIKHLHCPQGFEPNKLSVYL
jgi:hypothetical protein